MGYCVVTPANMFTAMNVAMSVVSRPLRRAYTGPIEKVMELITPAAVTAATPSGEISVQLAKCNGAGHDDFRGQL